LVRMSEARQIKALEDARDGVGSKERRSGGVSWDRTVRFSMSATGHTADLLWGRLDRLVVTLRGPG
jgi:hypothetical protein